MDLHDDHYLFQQLVAGDPRAARIAHDRFVDQLFYFVNKMVNNDEDARDIVADVFCQVFKKIETIKDLSHFRHFLFFVARNFTVNYFKKKNREKKKTEQIKHLTEISEEAMREDEISARFYETLYERIRLLAPKTQEAFVLTAIKGKSYDETAELMNLRPQTIRNYHANAIQQLKEYFANREMATKLLILVVATSCLLLTTTHKRAYRKAGDKELIASVSKN